MPSISNGVRFSPVSAIISLIAPTPDSRLEVSIGIKMTLEFLLFVISFKLSMYREVIMYYAGLPWPSIFCEMIAMASDSACELRRRACAEPSA